MLQRLFWLFQCSKNPLRYTIIGVYFISGPTLPSPRKDFSMIEVEQSLFVIGGYSGYYAGNTVHNLIYKLQCVSGTCIWKKINQQIKEPRSWPVVIPVPDSLINCEEEQKSKSLHKATNEVTNTYMKSILEYEDFFYLMIYKHHHQHKVV